MKEELSTKTRTESEDVYKRQPLGFDWKLGVGILSGVGAKELVVSTLGVLYADDAEADAVSSVSYTHLDVYKRQPSLGGRITPSTTSPVFRPNSLICDCET